MYMGKKTHTTDTNRRQLLRSAGSLAVATTIFSATAGARKSRDNSASQREIVNRARTLMRERKFKQANELLEAHGIDYTSSSVNLGKESGGPDGISTEVRYRQDKSDLTLYVTNKYEDIYNVDAYMYLQGTNDELRYTSKAGDGFGIVFDHDEWSAVNPDKDDVLAEIEYYERSGGPPGSNGPGIVVKDWNPNYGVATGVFYPNEASVGYDTYIHLGIELEDTTDPGEDPAPVRTKYQHNGTYTKKSSTVSFNVGPAGLSFNLSDVKKFWDLDVTEQI